MLFADNSISFAFPIGRISLFIKFYELRDANSPGKPSIHQIETRIVREDGSEIEERHPISDAEFLSKRLINLFENLVNDGSYRQPIFNSDRATFHYKILPGIYIRLTDFYYEFIKTSEEDEEFIDEVEDSLITLADTTDLKEKAYSVNNSDLSIFYENCDDYNIELFKRLKQANLWEEYREKRHLDISMTEQTLNEMINSFDFVLKK